MAKLVPNIPASFVPVPVPTNSGVRRGSMAVSVFTEVQYTPDWKTQVPGCRPPSYPQDAGTNAAIRTLPCSDTTLQREGDYSSHQDRLSLVGWAPPVYEMAVDVTPQQRGIHPRLKVGLPPPNLRGPRERYPPGKVGGDLSQNDYGFVLSVSCGACCSAISRFLSAALETSIICSTSSRPREALGGLGKLAGPESPGRPGEPT